MSPNTGLLSSGLSNSQTELFESFADVTLAEDDTNSILADDANILQLGNMEVMVVIKMVVEQ